MGRSRRRERRDFLRRLHGDSPSPAAAALPFEPALEAPAPALQPLYVSVGAAAQSVNIAPVLEIEGLHPWEEIHGPPLATDEPEAAVAAPAPDSQDPLQLELASVKVEEAPPPALADPPAATESAEATDSQVEPQAPIADAAPVEAAVAVELEVEAPPEPAPVAVDPIEERHAEAKALAEAGKLAEARQAYRALLAERPTHVAARNNLALLLEHSGDQDGALAELDRALDQDSENVTLLVNRGALLGAMGRYAAAERDLKRVLRDNPSHGEALFNLGVVMTKKGLWAEAVPLLARVVETEPMRGPAWYYLGEALNHVDDLPGAMAAYQRAAELMPDNPRALYGLGIVYDRTGRPDDAARMYRKSRAIGRR